jgi:hypothetical protein
MPRANRHFLPGHVRHITHRVTKKFVQNVPIVQWFDRSRSLTAGFLDGLQFRAHRGITMTGPDFRSFLR